MSSNSFASKNRKGAEPDILSSHAAICITPSAFHPKSSRQKDDHCFSSVVSCHLCLTRLKICNHAALLAFYWKMGISLTHVEQAARKYVAHHYTSRAAKCRLDGCAAMFCDGDRDAPGEKSPDTNLRALRRYPFIGKCCCCHIYSARATMLLLL